MENKAMQFNFPDLVTFPGIVQERGISEYLFISSSNSSPYIFRWYSLQDIVVTMQKHWLCGQHALCSSWCWSFILVYLGPFQAPLLHTHLPPSVLCKQQNPTKTLKWNLQHHGDSLRSTELIVWASTVTGWSQLWHSELLPLFIVFSEQMDDGT